MRLLFGLIAVLLISIECVAGPSAEDIERAKKVRHFQLRTTIVGPKARINAISVSPDGTKIAAAFDNSLVGVYDRVSGRELHILKGQEASISSVKFSANGRELYTGSRDGSIFVWNSNTGVILRKNKPLSTVYNFGIFQSSDQWDISEWLVVAGEQEGESYFSTIDATGSIRSRSQTSSYGESHVASSPDGSKVAWSDEQIIYVATANFYRDRKSSKMINGARVSDLAFSLDGNSLISSGINGEIEFFDVGSGRRTRVLNDRSRFGSGRVKIAVPSDSNLIYSTLSGAIVIWDLTSGEPKHWISSTLFTREDAEEFKLADDHQENVTALAVVPRENTIVSGDAMGVLKVWKNPDALANALLAAEEPEGPTASEESLNSIGVAGNKCSICLEVFKEDAKVVKPCKTCKSGYCPECIQPWLLNNDTCPTCRGTLKSENLVQIELRLSESSSQGQGSESGEVD